MGATIIDSLTVTLGLDPANYTKGRKQVEAENKKLSENSRKTANDMGGDTKRVTEGFSSLRSEILSLLTIFTAGKGFEAFIKDIGFADAATGRLAKTMDTSTEELARWQQAAELSGGSADGMTSSLQNLVSQFQTFQMTGESSLIPYLRALQVNFADAHGKMRPFTEIMLDLATKFQGMDPAKAAAFGRAMGFDQGTINLLVQGRKAVQGYLDEAEKLGHANRESAAAGAKIQREWKGVEAAWKDSARTLLIALTPAITKVAQALSALAEWFSKHKGALIAAFTALAAVVAALSVILAVQFVAALGAATVAAGPWLLVAAALAAVGVLIYENWDAVSGVFSAFAQAVSDAMPEFSGLKETFDGIDWVLKQLDPTLDSSTKKLDHMTEAARALGTVVGKLFGAIGWLIAPGFMVEGQAKAILGQGVSSSGTGSGAGRSRATGAAASNFSSGIGSGQGDLATLMSFGWTKEQAAGILGNLQWESGGKTTAVGDGGSAYGLAQWHADRQANFAAMFGHSIKDSTRDEQLAFVNYELTHGESRAGNALRGTSDAASAASVFMRMFERPASSASEAGRTALANKFLAGSGFKPPSVGTSLSDAARMFSTGGATNTSTASTNIGQINIKTAATDAKGIARDIHGAVAKHSLATQANSGLA